jgi:Flp pilus assembly pilin Flp
MSALRDALAAAHCRREEDGQALMEYALILSLVALVTVAGVTAVGDTVLTLLNSVVNAFP